jgi:hypothetical protein
VTVTSHPGLYVLINLSGPRTSNVAGAIAKCANYSGFY